MKVIVTNIQRFSLHDGPGIRTTVFLKGCNLSCPWCSNPENLNFEVELYSNEGTSGTYGYEIELNDLEKEILKDKPFYENGGGVTFSGGEALLQFDKLEPLLQSLKKQNINMCIETALSVPEHLVEIALQYIDEFIVDIKILDEETIDKINGNLNFFKTNIKKIFVNKKNVIFRIPLAKDYIVTEKNIHLILEFLSNMKKLLEIHNLAEKKYKTLHKKMVKLETIKQEKIKEIKNKIEELGIQVEICKL